MVPAPASLKFSRKQQNFCMLQPLQQQGLAEVEGRWTCPVKCWIAWPIWCLAVAFLKEHLT